MDSDVKRRANRERLALGQTDMSGARTHHGATIMSPIVTNRPEIDSMLGDMAYCSKQFLENMRNVWARGDIPNRQELKDFKDICETVLRQAKTEMELEKHATARDDRMKPEEIRATIQEALSRAGRGDVTEIVLEALGLSLMN
jgi:hypothetical protein